MSNTSGQKSRPNFFFWVLLVFLGLWLFSVFTGPPSAEYKEVPYNVWVDSLKDHKYNVVVITQTNLVGIIKGEQGSRDVEIVTGRMDDPTLLTRLQESKVPFKVENASGGSIFGFLINLLISLLPVLLIVGFWLWIMIKQAGNKLGSFSEMGKSKSKIEVIDNTSVTFKDVAGCDEAKYELEEIVDFLRNPNKYGVLGGKLPKGVLLVGPTGTGKAQPLHSLVKTPTGWIKMGDIVPGMLVTTPSGKNVPVISVHPQGMKDRYKISFDDDSSTECCPEHLWRVHHKDWGKTSTGPWRTVTAEFLKDRFDRGMSLGSIPMLNGKISGHKIPLPVDPYVLGCLLGDGMLKYHACWLSSKDDELIELFNSKLIDGYKLKYHTRGYDYVLDHIPEARSKIKVGQGTKGVFINYYTQAIYDLGLWNSSSYTKFIPDLYLNSDYESRLELIRGLMDTDGTAEGTGGVYFTSTSFELIKGLQYLLMSIGAKAKIGEAYQNSYSYNGENRLGRSAWNLSIWHQTPEILFNLKRKRKNVENVRKDGRVIIKRNIVSIEEMPPCEMQCILIDDPEHLYLTDDFIVTHNTLLAKALAGEAKVTFFRVSGSDFMEMFVGVGASRVRDLFAQAKQKMPCIVFIDEIDALGSARTGGSGMSGHDEKGQTLNQLLVEMDGFEGRDGIIIVGATNRPEVLDPALLRPGRFDRQVVVDRPDKKGREEIFAVHLPKIKYDTSVSVEKLASITPGFTGADIANMVNESALLATRRNAEVVEIQDFQESIERVIAGLQKKTKLMSPVEKKRVSYHEIGHTLTALALEGTDPVHKVTIVPRSMGALGYTLNIPDAERYLKTKADLLKEMIVLMGGRAAEFVKFDDFSTGASNDIQRATIIARDIVTRYGMGSLGMAAWTFDKKNFLGYAVKDSPDVSDETARAIDKEITELVGNAFEWAVAILRKNNDHLNELSEKLLVVETLHRDDFPVIDKENIALGVDSVTIRNS